MPEKITKQDLENFLDQVKNSEEYENPEFAKVIDDFAIEIRSHLIIQGVLDSNHQLDNFVIKKIDRVIDAIGTAITIAAADHKEFPFLNDEKLKEMVMGYPESIITAKEIDPKAEIKPVKEVLARIKNLGPDILREIAKFQRPTLLVTPKNSFLEKKENMDHHKRYVDEKGKGQADTWHMEKEDSPYLEVSTSDSTLISIVEGAARLKHRPDIIPCESQLEERKKAFINHYIEKKILLISVHEYAVLMQRSLREYRRHGNDKGKILDYFENEKDTVTCLGDRHLKKTTRIPVAFFAARKVSFSAYGPDFTIDNFCARPSHPLMLY